jgi:hypothetical protein
VESDAYKRGVARARAVMAGEAEPSFAPESSKPPAPEPEAGELLQTHEPAEVPAARIIRYQARATAFLNWHAGKGVTEDGRRFTFTAEADVAELLNVLDVLEVRRAFLSGPRPHEGDADTFRWWFTSTAGAWEADGHYLGKLSTPILRFRRHTRRIVLHRAAGWFGDTDAGALELRAAWAALGELVGRRFRGAVLLDTPATTGRHLFQLVAGHEHPVLPDDVQHLIRSTAGQARIELLAPEAETIPGLCVYDGRFAYAACAAELPTGMPEHWRGEHPHGDYARSRQLVDFTVPASWDHVGLLPEMAGDGWSWPSKPGHVGRSWVDGVEVALARRHGWNVKPLECLVWPTKGDPMKPWVRRLVALREDAEQLQNEAVRQLVRGAVRSMLVAGVGAFHGRPHMVTKSAPLGERVELPEGATIPEVQHDALVWQEPTPARWAELSHPEWSAAVWARARVRLLDAPAPDRQRVGALHVPRAELLGFRTDAVYMTADPSWPDDGAVGRFRLELAHVGELPAPRSSLDLLRLWNELEATHG